MDSPLVKDLNVIGPIDRKEWLRLRQSRNHKQLRQYLKFNKEVNEILQSFTEDELRSFV
jgi:hypothetical protein